MQTCHFPADLAYLVICLYLSVWVCSGTLCQYRLCWTEHWRSRSQSLSQTSWVLLCARGIVLYHDDLRHDPAGQQEDHQLSTAQNTGLPIQKMCHKYTNKVEKSSMLWCSVVSDIKESLFWLTLLTFSCRCAEKACFNQVKLKIAKGIAKGKPAQLVQTHRVTQAS